MTELLRLLWAKLRPLWFPLAAVGSFEWYARTAGQGSDALAGGSVVADEDVAGFARGGLEWLLA